MFGLDKVRAALVGFCSCQEDRASRCFRVPFKHPEAPGSWATAIVPLCLLSSSSSKCSIGSFALRAAGQARCRSLHSEKPALNEPGRHRQLPRTPLELSLSAEASRAVLHERSWLDDGKVGSQGTASDAPPPLWRCLRCGGPMLLVERLTPTEARFRSPPTLPTIEQPRPVLSHLEPTTSGTNITQAPLPMLLHRSPRHSRQSGATLQAHRKGPRNTFPAVQCL
jgi:hypothetical protein